MPHHYDEEPSILQRLARFASGLDPFNPYNRNVAAGLGQGLLDAVGNFVQLPAQGAAWLATGDSEPGRDFADAFRSVVPEENIDPIARGVGMVGGEIGGTLLGGGAIGAGARAAGAAAKAGKAKTVLEAVGRGGSTPGGRLLSDAARFAPVDAVLGANPETSGALAIAELAGGGETLRENPLLRIGAEMGLGFVPGAAIEGVGALAKTPRGLSRPFVPEAEPRLVPPSPEHGGVFSPREPKPPLLEAERGYDAFRAADGGLNSPEIWARAMDEGDSPRGMILQHLARDADGLRSEHGINRMAAERSAPVTARVLKAFDEGGEAWSAVPSFEKEAVGLTPLGDRVHRDLEAAYNRGPRIARGVNDFPVREDIQSGVLFPDITDGEFIPSRELDPGTRAYLGRRLPERGEPTFVKNGVIMDASPVTSDRVVYRGWTGIDDREVGSVTRIDSPTSASAAGGLSQRFAYRKPRRGGAEGETEEARYLADGDPNVPRGTMYEVRVREGTPAVITNERELEYIFPTGLEERVVARYDDIMIPGDAGLEENLVHRYYVIEIGGRPDRIKVEPSPRGGEQGERFMAAVDDFQDVDYRVDWDDADLDSNEMLFSLGELQDSIDELGEGLRADPDVPPSIYNAASDVLGDVMRMARSLGDTIFKFKDDDLTLALGTWQGEAPQLRDALRYARRVVARAFPPLAAAGVGEAALPGGLAASDGEAGGGGIPGWAVGLSAFAGGAAIASIGRRMATRGKGTLGEVAEEVSGGEAPSRIIDPSTDRPFGEPPATSAATRLEAYAGAADKPDRPRVIPSHVEPILRRTEGLPGPQPRGAAEPIDYQKIIDEHEVASPMRRRIDLRVRRMQEEGSLERSVETNEAAIAEAESILANTGGKPKDLIRGPRMQTAGQFYASRTMLNELDGQISRIEGDLERAREGVLSMSDEEMATAELAVKALEADAVALTDKIFRSGTELGRALRARDPAKAPGAFGLKIEDPFFWIGQARKQRRDGFLTEDEMADIRALVRGGDFDAVRDRIAGLRRSTAWEKIEAIFTGNLLSAPATHTKNVAGNATFVAMRNASSPGEFLADRLLAAGLKGLNWASRGRFGRDRIRISVAPTERAKASLRGVQEVANKLSEAAGTGTIFDEAKGFFDLPPQDLSKLELQRQVNFSHPEQRAWARFPNAILDTVYNRMIFGALLKEDRPFRAIGVWSSLLEQGHVDAVNSGLKKGTEEYNRHVALYTVNPPDEAILRSVGDTEQAAMIRRARKQATAAGDEAVFTEDNLLADAIVSLRKGLGDKSGAASFGLRMIVPFARVPVNLAKRAFMFSPMGSVPGAAIAVGRLLRHAGDNDTRLQKKAAEALNRMAVGGGLTWLGAQLALKGNVTGEYPLDRDARFKNTYNTAGVKPYSIRIGNNWYRYLDFPVMGPLMGLGATMVERAQQERDEAGPGEGEIEGMVDLLSTLVASGEISSEIAGRFASSLLESTPLRGLDLVSDVVGGLRNPKDWDRVLPNVGRMFAPAALSRVASGADPIARERSLGNIPIASQLAGGFAEGVPGLRQQLPPRIDETTGQPVRNLTPGDTGAGRGALRLVDPLNTSGSSDDPISHELLRLGTGVPDLNLSGSLDKEWVERQSAEGLTQLESHYGQAGYEAIRRVMASPGYQRWDDEKRAEKIEEAISDARRGVTRELRRMYPASRRRSR